MQSNAIKPHRLSFAMGILVGVLGMLVSTVSTGDTTQAAGFPPLSPLPEPPVPADNPQTPAKVALGKMLFFEKRLSGDASLACATCHVAEQGWSFADQLSRGYPGTTNFRNSLSVVNAAYYNKLFWIGNADSLEQQAPMAATGKVEGNGSSEMMEARLMLIPEYRKRFKEVFGDDEPRFENIWKAIAAFERTVVQQDTPLDNYLRGDKSALSEQQQRGLALFNGKAGCIQCHNGPFATDESFHNTGAPSLKHREENGLAQITFRFVYHVNDVPEELYRNAKTDAGLYFRTRDDNDKGKFRTPTLRYSLYTAPYMHNGVFFTLEEVVDFYNRGGVDDKGRTTDFLHTKSPLIQPLGLSDNEKEDLVAFLEAFSGEEISIETPALPEYAPLFTLNELKAVKK